jgi:ribonuclease VapC
MVIETSALVAVALQEKGFEEYVFKMADADRRSLSAASYLEASIVLLNRRGPEAVLDLDRTIAGLEIEIVPVTAVQSRIGRQAHADFGKGRHPAKLNLGDCFSYALAKQRNEPLLFKGNDFSQTDIRQA